MQESQSFMTRNLISILNYRREVLRNTFHVSILYDKEFNFNPLVTEDLQILIEASLNPL